jgi:hypothetical protein
MKAKYGLLKWNSFKPLVVEVRNLRDLSTYVITLLTCLIDIVRHSYRSLWMVKMT